MRHKKIIFLYVSLVTCVLLSGLFLNSCKQDEVVNTPTLSVFGPSPAIRGGVIKFIGTNLDKVTSIMLPNNIEVKDITKTSATEISITIPQETKPGLVILKSASGDITTKTPLTFSEPISIDTYTTTAVKAGDVFTIGGDYLNLVAQVIFSDGAVVDSSKFISKSRKELKVYVPKAAKTGKVAVSNGATIPVLVYTVGNATVTDPTTLTSISPVPVKPGEDLTIAGTYLNLVKQVILPDGNKIDSAAITVNAAKTAITVKVPLTAKEGVVKMITYSGLEITSTAVMKLVSPAITTATPLLIKNGASLTITGTNLDLVTTAAFGAVEGAITAQSATSITVTVPMTAVDGAVVLNTNSGLTATSAALTLVKPAFTSITPLALTAGEKVTIAGTDLDLVRKVIFLGGSVAVTPANGVTSLEVTVPTTCAGIGVVTLETVNGTKVASTDQLAIKAATTPAIISITPTVSDGGLMTITGKNLNYVESIYFENNVKAILYGVRTETSITVYIPKEAKHGQTTFTMNSFVGEKIVSDKFTYGPDPVQDPALMIFDFDSGLTANGGTWNGVGGLGNPTDALSGAYYEIKASNWGTGYWWFAENYMTHPSVPKAGYVLKADIRLRKDIAAASAEVRIMIAGKVVNILPYLKVGDVWTTGGEWKTITIPVSAWTDLADPTPTKGGEWGIATWVNASDFTGFCIDNIRYEKVSGASSAPKFKLIGM